MVMLTRRGSTICELAPCKDNTSSHFADSSQRDSFDDIVHILVGPEKEIFKVHRQILCNTSSYFDAALNGNFKEAKQGRVEMLEDDVNTFKNFQYWLYSREIHVEEGNEIYESNNNKQWDMLIDLFIFGEARGIPGLQNAAIDGLIDEMHAKNELRVAAIRRIYENTPENSPLRRLYVDIVHSSAYLDRDLEHGAWFAKKEYSVYKKEFLFDLAAAYCQRVNGEIEKIKDFTAVRSNYHVSAPNERTRKGTYRCDLFLFLPHIYQRARHV